MGTAMTFAIAAALLLGSSDFFAARSARTTPAITVTRTAVLLSAVLSPLLLLLVDFEWILQDSVLGALSGVAMITGLMLAYHGYKVSRIGIVAPLSSVLLAAVPVVWTLIGGATPSGWSTAGMALGAIAVVLTSYTPGGSGSAVHGALFGIASGVAFGIAFTLMGEVSDQAGLAPVILQRLAGLAVLTGIWAVRKDAYLATGVGRRTALLTGLFGVTAIASLQIAFQHGDSGPVAVASSQFATVAVLLSVLFNHERMRWWQAAGVATTALAVSLIAVGG